MTLISDVIPQLTESRYCTIALASLLDVSRGVIFKWYHFGRVVPGTSHRITLKGYRATDNSLWFLRDDVISFLSALDNSDVA